MIEDRMVIMAFRTIALAIVFVAFRVNPMEGRGFVQFLATGILMNSLFSN
jgi:fumarate reductase subunit C